eukprot:SAG31_NODE_418_length_15893_cov_5.433899_13_plen_90_part_00
MLTLSASFSQAIVVWDGHPVGNGTVGPGKGGYVLVFVQLFEKYGTLIERYAALIEKVSALISGEGTGKTSLVGHERPRASTIGCLQSEG